MPLSTPSCEEENKKSVLLGALFFVAAIVILLLAAEITDEIFWEIHPDQPHMNVDIYTPIFIWGPVSLIYFLAIGLVGASVDPAITITIIMVAMTIFGAIRYMSLVSAYLA